MKENKTLNQIFNRRRRNVVEDDYAEYEAEYSCCDDDCAASTDDMVNEITVSNVGPSFERITYVPLQEGEKPLGNVIGHEKQKHEVMLTLNWFKKSKELKKRGVSVPKGIIFYGRPGNGKSLLIKEIVRFVDLPTFVFKGDSNDIAKGIYDIFGAAKEVGRSIVIIDELDLLIDKDARIIRALQENLDGVESNDDILVITATNNIDSIPAALKRHGRLEKKIHIPRPREEEALALFNKFAKEFDIKFAEEIDDDELKLSLSGLSCAGVKSVVNDVVLRNGFEGITSDMIEESIFGIERDIHTPNPKKYKQVSIHEASHAFVASLYPEYFACKRLNIDGGSGEFETKCIEEDYTTFDEVLANIRTLYAGFIAEKYIYGIPSRGSEHDLEQARILAYNLINRCGYSSCWETLPIVCDSSRKETQIKRRRMERKIERLLKRLEKETTKIVVSNKETILRLADKLYEKKRLKASEIMEILNNHK